ncbi:hypothetical protein B4U79_03395, partial [Dinothrombium tinctorium]
RYSVRNRLLFLRCENKILKQFSLCTHLTGCVYQNKKYPHGEQVITSEPCLNCTCKKGVLLCFLRVCPALIAAPTSEDCQTVREPGQCCPVLKCLSNSTTTTTYSTLLDESETPFFSTISTTSNYVEDDDPNTSTVLSIDNKSSSDASVTAALETGTLCAHNRNTFVTKFQNRVTITQRDGTTVFQTNPTTVFHDSPKYVTSSPESLASKSEEEDLASEINSITGGCYINGSHYAEGSAVMSSSFCEYCYCIRSKRMCIRPRCHLSILGCIPRYTSEYACCPTSYVCGNALSFILLAAHRGHVFFLNKGQNAISLRENPLLSTTTTTTLKPITKSSSRKDATQPLLRSESMAEESKVNKSREVSSDGEVNTLLDNALNESEIAIRETTENLLFNELRERNDLNDNDSTTAVESNHEMSEEFVTVSGDIKLTTATEVSGAFANSTGVYTAIENVNVVENETNKSEVNASVDDSNKLKEANKHLLHHSKAEEDNSLWRSEDAENKPNATQTPRDKIEEMLDGIIHALDKRLQSSLPAEPRLPIKKITEFFANIKTGQHASKKQEIQPIYTPNDAAYQQASPYIPLNKYYSTSRSQPTEESKEETKKQAPIEYKRGSVFDEDAKVEIITAGTPLVQTSSNDDTILVNLSPASFKVGSVLPDENDHIKRDHSVNNHQPQLVSFPSHYTNEWKAVNDNHAQRPHSPTEWHTLSHMNAEIPKESLYYRQIPKSESNKSDVTALDKKARLDVQENAEFYLTSYGNQMKYTPFAAHDASVAYNGNILQKNNGSAAVRVPINRNNGHPLNKPMALSSLCIVDKMEYANGAIIPKPDPCVVCRCFYGRELCQQQKCPSAPRPDCTPEFVSGFCCPRYTCPGALNELPKHVHPVANNDAKHSLPLPDKALLPINDLPFRKAPQYPSPHLKTTKAPSTTPRVMIPIDKVTEPMRPENYNMFDENAFKNDRPKETLAAPVPGFPSVPSHVHEVQNKRPPFPLDPTPRPFVQQLFGFLNQDNKQGTRVHFPHEKKPESKPSTSDKLAVQPPRSDSVGALVPPRPQPPPAFVRHPQQATSGNNYMNRMPQPYAATPQRQSGWKIPPQFSGPNQHHALESNTSPVKISAESKPTAQSNNNVSNKSETLSVKSEQENSIKQ